MISSAQNINSFLGAYVSLETLEIRIKNSNVLGKVNHYYCALHNVRTCLQRGKQKIL